MMKPLWAPVLAESARTLRAHAPIVMVAEVPRGDALAGTSLHITRFGRWHDDRLLGSRRLLRWGEILLALHTCHCQALPRHHHPYTPAAPQVFEARFADPEVPCEEVCAHTTVSTGIHDCSMAGRRACWPTWGTSSLLEFPGDASSAARTRKPFSARLDALAQIVTLARAHMIRGDGCVC